MLDVSPSACQVVYLRRTPSPVRLVDIVPTTSALSALAAVRRSMCGASPFGEAEDPDRPHRSRPALTTTSNTSRRSHRRPTSLTKQSAYSTNVFVNRLQARLFSNGFPNTRSCESSLTAAAECGCSGNERFPNGLGEVARNLLAKLDRSPSMNSAEFSECRQRQQRGSDGSACGGFGEVGVRSDHDPVLVRDGDDAGISAGAGVSAARNGDRAREPDRDENQCEHRRLWRGEDLQVSPDQQNQ